LIRIDWEPVAHIGSIPVNWYGLGWATAFLAGRWLVLRWARGSNVPRERLEELLMWILLGAFGGARLYYVAQNDSWFYLTHPWRIVAVWEGGLAFFGGLFGAIGASLIYTKRNALRFPRVADLIAPAIPIAGAIGRIPCGLDGMDYGTPSSLPWSVVYTNPNSFAPTDGVPRHPDQYYELLGDLVIAWVLLKLRPRLPEGATFYLYLTLFAVLRFALFFVRGNVPIVAFGLKNAQLTAVVILAVAIPALASRLRRGRPAAA
jgi:phosphatidylglycerol:prolipoprotein diacylglycerol transferase